MGRKANTCKCRKIHDKFKKVPNENIAAKKKYKIGTGYYSQLLEFSQENLDGIMANSI